MHHQYSRGFVLFVPYEHFHLFAYAYYNICIRPNQVYAEIFVLCPYATVSRPFTSGRLRFFLYVILLCAHIFSMGTFYIFPAHLTINRCRIRSHMSQYLLHLLCRHCSPEYLFHTRNSEVLYSQPFMRYTHICREILPGQGHVPNHISSAAFPVL